MNEILKRIFANGFRDLAGLTVSGSVPIKEELINEMLIDFLAKAKVPGQPAVTEAPTAPPSSVDVKALLGLVKKVSLEATPGIITVNFDVRA